MPPTALIAEDEPLLAAALKTELRAAWPELQIVATVGDGASAVREALALQPDVLFLDIRMPGMSGLNAAVALADAWPMNVNSNGTLGGNLNGTFNGTLDPHLARPAAPPFPALVFITAYDQYAVQAFDAQAIDYVLKPVQAARLQKTVSKVQLALASRSSVATYFEATLAQLRALASVALSTGANTTSATGANTTSATGANTASATGANTASPTGVKTASHFGVNSTGSPGPAPAPLRVIQASVGNSIRMVPVDDVLCFEAANKYVRVLTADHEYLIRTPLKDLLPQLDAQRFWQVHRGTLVQAERIESVTRDEAGKLWLGLRGYTQKLLVSRLYAHLFKAM